MAALPAALQALLPGHAPPPTAWNPDLLVLLPLAAAALLYALGRAALALRGRRAAVARWEALAFAAGLATLVVALVSPVDRLAERFFAVHMGQHELLMLVAAPLVVLGRPLVPYLAALPAGWQARAIAWSRRRTVAAAWTFATAPLVAFAVHGAVRWLWHVPALFDGALAHPRVHALQHLSFFATAALFWWSLLHGRYGRAGYGVAILAVFATAAHTGLLGAILTLAPAPIYRTYAARLGDAALADQTLAGLLMWVPAGTLLVVVGLALFVAWLGEAARRAPRERA